MCKASFILLILLPLAFLSSCKQDQKTYYCIRDYKAELRPMLYNIVNNGILTPDTGFYYIKNNTTDQELVKLSRCEHPLIRACALEFMLKRTGFNKQDVINEHLDDSAVFTLDWGEFGLVYRQVSDYILEEGEWVDSAAKTRTIQEVLTRHKQLVSAYTILRSLKQDSLYYPIIRDMTGRTYHQAGVEYGRAGFPEYRHILIACYALASYNKPADRPLIKKVLAEHLWRWTDDAFYIMKKYPDDAYLDLLESYYKHYFYSNICNGDITLETASLFIETVAVYKNKRSADILSAILNNKSTLNCFPTLKEADKDLMHYIYSVVYNNQSEAYKEMLPAAEKYINSFKDDRVRLSMTTGTGPDKTIHTLRW